MSAKPVVLTAAFAVFAACAVACRGAEPAPSTPAPSAPATPAAAPVAAPEPAREASAEPFEVAGTANAARTARISAKVGGIMSLIRVRDGTSVTQGQLLAALDTTDFEIRAEQAAVAAATALAGVESAESDLKRARDLFKGGSLTDQAIEKAELGLRIAKLQHDGAKVAVRAAQQALADAQFRAPFSGVITKMMFDEGQMIATMPPTILYILVDTSVLEVKVPIPERMLAHVQVGMPVVVRLPAVGVEREAKIDRMPEVIDPVTRSVEAVIRLDNKDRKIPAGLYARVKLPGVRADQGVSEVGEIAAQQPGSPEAATAQ